MTAFGGFRRWVVVEATLVPGTLRGDTECTGQVNRARCPRGVPRHPAPRTLTPGPVGAARSSPVARCSRHRRRRREPAACFAGRLNGLYGSREKSRNSLGNSSEPFTSSETLPNGTSAMPGGGMLGAAGSRGAERGPGRPVSSPTALQLRPRLSKCRDEQTSKRMKEATSAAPAGSRRPRGPLRGNATCQRMTTSF